MGGVKDGAWFSIDTTTGPKYALPKHFHVLRGTSATVPDGGPP